MTGKFLSCYKVVKDLFEVQEGRCDFTRDAAAKKGLIYPGRENLLAFIELPQVPLQYVGDLRDPLVWPQEWPVSLRGARGLPGILSSRCQVVSPPLEPRPELEVSSTVLTWILGFLWRLHRGVRPGLM